MINYIIYKVYQECTYQQLYLSRHAVPICTRLATAARRTGPGVPCDTRQKSRVCQSGNASAELAACSPPIPAAPQGMEPNCLRQAVSVERLDANLPFPWLPLPSLPADVGSRPPAVLHNFFPPISRKLSWNSRTSLVRASDVQEQASPLPFLNLPWRLVSSNHGPNLCPGIKRLGVDCTWARLPER